MSLYVFLRFCRFGMSKQNKRPLGLQLTGNTPNKPPKKSARRRAGTPRESLVFSDKASKEETCSSASSSTNNATWEEKEISALVQFIALFHESDAPNVWPSHKRTDFWERCATAISKYCGLPQRSDMYEIIWCMMAYSFVKYSLYPCYK